MPKIKPQKRSQIDYPSGRGAGLPAAGVHAVDRKLGALPTSFRMQAYSGQPSTSADSGFSRATQRVNRGFEADKLVQNIPEISWLKTHEKQLTAMGLTPRAVVETYMALVKYRPQTPQERVLISELKRRVVDTRMKVRSITRLALMESVTRVPGRLDEGALDYLKGKAAEYFGVSLGDEESSEAALADAEKEGMDSALSAGAKSSTGRVSRDDVEEMVKEDDVTSSVLACNSRSLEILQTVLAVTGVFGDLATFFGLPVGMAADVVNCCINLICGHYFHATLDAIAIFPFVGDLSKIFYAKRIIKTLGVAQDAKFLRGEGSIAEQAAEAAEIIEKAITDRTIGPKVSKIILRMKSAFGSAERMADKIGNLLKRATGRMITFFEGIQAGAASGSMLKKGAAWILSKIPLDLLSILKKIQDEGIPALKDFVVDLFGRKGAQKTASGAQVKSALHEPEEGADGVEKTTGADDAGQMDVDPDGDGIPGPFGPAGFSGDEIDPDGDGIPGPFGGAGQFGGISGPRDYYGDDDEGLPSPYLFEAKKRGKGAKKAKRISLIKAMGDNDDSVLDEFSTVAGSLGPAGKEGAGGYIIPMGMKPSGSPRSKLDKLVPGYEFVKGRSPYSY
jgi:hypothetical protein